ncbi:MAG: hypothetical protein LW823_09165 [Rickettsiales bacterium]|jgi:predicted DNA binding CopG/RHH family protein|nr:hypothetical protein [Rickettsiales bacterium]
MRKNRNKNLSKHVRYSKPNRDLDGEDMEMLEAIERGDVEFKRIKDYDAFVKKSKQAAKNYFKKNARVSFRISEVDLENVKRMAANEGLPYQTYLTSIIHKLTTGQLKPTY